MQESLEIIDKGIQAHFNREETALLTAFEEHSGGMFTFALCAWLAEHVELGDRLAKLERDVIELAAGGLSSGVWEGRVWGIRVYISHSWKIFEEHARGEQKLLQTLNNRLQAEIKEKIVALDYVKWLLADDLFRRLRYEKGVFGQCCRYSASSRS